MQHLHLRMFCPAAMLTLLFMSSIAGGEPISNLEAIHAAERAVTGTAVSCDTVDLDGVSHAVVRMEADAVKHRVWVDDAYGRITQVDRQERNTWVTVYRWPGVLVVAHRGGAKLGPPENTLAAIEKAIEVGADLIEIDIRETRDGQLVIMHDSTVDRTTDGSGKVVEMTLEEIRRLDAGSWAGPEYQGLKVPTLKEALECMKGRIRPDLDFKTGNLQRMVAVVNEAGVADQCTHHGAWDRCKELVELEPRVRIRPTIEYAQQVPELARLLRPPIINMDWHAITEESIRLAHLAGCEAFINCLGRADTLPYAEYCALNGADYIQSDRPDLVIEMLQRLGLDYDPEIDKNNELKLTRQ